MGDHAGPKTSKLGRYRGRHGDEPIFSSYDYENQSTAELFKHDEEVPSYTLDIRRGRWHLKRATALAAVVVLTSVGCWYIIANQTSSSPYALSEPSTGASGQPTSRLATDPQRHQDSPQPVPTATVTLPGTQRTVRVSVPPMKPQTVPTVTLEPGPTQTVWRTASPQPAPTVTVTRTVSAPRPTKTIYVPRLPIQVTVTVTVTPAP